MRSGNGTTSNSTRDLTGQTCVITGATSGLGKAVALALGRLNAGLVLVGRNERAGAALARALRRPSSSAPIEYVRADLSRQSDVRALAERIAGTYRSVDILINNAGARFDAYGETPDGIELTFATNHLGHFLLTCLLAERLVEAVPPARVITVSSSTHVNATAEGPWSSSRQTYDRRLAYAKSKLANVMFAYELAERLTNTGVTSNAIDPGIVATNFARNNGVVSWLRHLMAHGLRRELISPRNGARPLVHLAVSNGLAGVTGKYFRRDQQVDSSPASRDRQQARRLWELSVRLTGLTRLPVALTVPDLVRS